MFFRLITDCLPSFGTVRRIQPHRQPPLIHIVGNAAELRILALQAAMRSGSPKAKSASFSVSGNALKLIMCLPHLSVKCVFVPYQKPSFRGEKDGFGYVSVIQFYSFRRLMTG